MESEVARWRGDQNEWSPGQLDPIGDAFVLVAVLAIEEADVIARNVLPTQCGA